ncbi:MAG: MATE family efflux transporter [Clostridiales bacterium]|jgi:putative MATE family efflux protein|nr:MATE family efflux transporter [Clostridiales bacterium]
MFKEENKIFLKALFFLALPIIAQDTISAMVNALDVIMIGSLGDEAIAATGIANQTFFLYFLFSFGVVSGASVFMGQFWGKGDVKSVRKTLGVALGLSTFFACVFTLLVITIPDRIMSIFSYDPAVIKLAVEYLRAVWPCYLVIAITMPLNFALRCMGKPVFPMITMVCSLLFNALFNYLFIYVFGWGVRGAAYATVLARFLELAAQMILIKKFRLPVLGKWSEYVSADFAFIKSYVKVAAPIFFNEVTWALGTSAYNLAYKECGTAAQSAVQIAMNIQQIFQVAGFAFGSACAVMLSNALGAGEIKKAISYSRKCLATISAANVCTSALLLLCSNFIVSLFNISPQVREYTHLLLVIVAAVIVVKVFNYTLVVGILRSGGDTMFCLILDMCSVWCVGLPLALIGALLLRLPIHFVMLLAASEEFFKLSFAAVRVFRNKWAKRLV